MLGTLNLPSPRLPPEHLPHMLLVSLLRENWHPLWDTMHKAVGVISGCAGQSVPGPLVALLDEKSA